MLLSSILDACILGPVFILSFFIFLFRKNLNHLRLFRSRDPFNADIALGCLSLLTGTFIIGMFEYMTFFKIFFGAMFLSLTAAWTFLLNERTENSAP